MHFDGSACGLHVSQSSFLQGRVKQIVGSSLHDKKGRCSHSARRVEPSETPMEGMLLQ